MSEEQRKYRRINVNITASIRIIFPEYTFTPFSCEGIIRDLSQRGMKLIADKIDQQTYTRLLGAPRDIRITITPPEKEDTHTLFGKIVWIDFNNRGPTPVTTLGICFEQLHEEDNEVLEYCIRILESKNENQK
jgi:hypothetical protein